MPIGRPRNPGTEAERTEARRAKVRSNVQAFRQRERKKKLAGRTVTAHQTREQQELSKESEPTVPTYAALPRKRSIAGGISVLPPDNPEFWLWAVPAELGARLTGTSYQDAFVQALQRRFVPSSTDSERPHGGSPIRLSICCSTWTTSADLDIRSPDTEVLMEALLAASLAITGRDRKDSDLTLHGEYMQTGALQRLRSSLMRYQEGDRSICPITLSLTALICAMSELIANKSWDNFNRHLLGVGALIFHGGAERLKGSAREHFYGYRAIQTPFLFMTRQRAFLSNPEWINFDWKTEVELAQRPLHSMLDIALQILPEITKQNMQRKWKTSCLQERLKRAQSSTTDLDRWERQLRSKHDGVLYTKIPSTWGSAFEYRLDFPSVSTAIAFAMYTAVRIHVAVLVATISDELLTRAPSAGVNRGSAVLDSLKWSRLACQSLEYFHTGAPKAAGRIVTLWPLETAWECFRRVYLKGLVDVSVEIAWCLATAKRQASLGIPPFQWR